MNNLIPLSFNLLKQELFKTSRFSTKSSNLESPGGGVSNPLDEILKLNKTILELFEHTGYLEQLY